MIINTKINKPRVTQKRLTSAQNRPVTINFTPESVRSNVDILNEIAVEEGWVSGLPNREQIKAFGSMFDDFFEKYFRCFPEHSRQQANNCVITSVIKLSLMIASRKNWKKPNTE